MAAVGESQLTANGENNWPSSGENQLTVDSSSRPFLGWVRFPAAPQFHEAGRCRFVPAVGHSTLTTSGRAQTAQATRVQATASLQADPAQAVQGSAQTEATQIDAEIAQVDADLASELIASGVTTQPVETVIAVLAASRDGASINAAARASGINYRTAQRIVEAATERRQGQLLAAS
jgi:hypothetical protein